MRELGNFHGREHAESTERRLAHRQPLVGEGTVGRKQRWLLGLLLNIAAGISVRELFPLSLFLFKARLYGLCDALQADDCFGLYGKKLLMKTTREVSV